MSARYRALYNVENSFEQRSQCFFLSFLLIIKYESLKYSVFINIFNRITILFVGILMQKGLSSFLICLTTIFCVGFLQAQVLVPSSCIPRPFDNTDFNLPATSNSTYQGNGVFRLTPNIGGQGGASWYRRRLDMRVNFRIAVELYLGANDVGADGIAFVLQNLDTGQGSTGGGLGYGGGTPISPSMAIEFDTWTNDGADPATGEDHIAFVTNGNTDTMPLAADITLVDNLENGNYHTVVISWNPDTQILGYDFTHSNGTVYSDTKSVNLIAMMGTPIAFWGFTASTGGFNNEQSVRFNDNSICVVDATFPVTVGNNYHTSTGLVSLTQDDTQYLCSLFSNNFYNTAYHNGENLEPTVGDYILYNNLYPPPQQLVQGTGTAYFKMFDYNKIVEVRKSDGEIIAVYNCP